MTREDKHLLLITLCGMLPYGVIVQENDGVNENDNKLLNIDMFDRCINYDYIIDDIKPYLRPMSSMTEEEAFNYKHLDLLDYSNDGFEMPNFRSIDWLNSHHFDYRGLIEKSLAIVAPEDMYNYENS